MPYQPPTSVVPYAPGAPPSGAAGFAPRPIGAAPYAPPSELPPAEGGRYERGGSKGGSRWYGWQILIPTLVSDMMILGGGISGSDAGLKVAIAGLVGHGISGPIVHFAHGQPLRAIGSLLLEAGLPGLVLGGALAGASGCREEVCIGPAVAMVIGLPVALTLGASLDAAALAWEPSSPTRDVARNLTVGVTPLVLPPLRMGSNRLPAPAGAALTGTF